MLEEARKHGKNLLDSGVIIGYNSNYSSNVALSLKSDRSFSFCIEMRMLNSKNDCCMLPILMTFSIPVHWKERSVSSNCTWDLDIGRWKYQRRKNTKKSFLCRWHRILRPVIRKDHMNLRFRWAQKHNI